MGMEAARLFDSIVITSPVVCENDVVVCPILELSISNNVYISPKWKTCHFFSTKYLRKWCLVNPLMTLNVSAYSAGIVCTTTIMSMSTTVRGLLRYKSD